MTLQQEIAPKLLRDDRLKQRATLHTKLRPRGANKFSSAGVFLQTLSALWWRQDISENINAAEWH